MPKRIRSKRIVVEVTDEMFDDIHKTAKELNITMRAYIWKLTVPDLLMRKRLREEK
jgi:hypothetical protein